MTPFVAAVLCTGVLSLAPAGASSSEGYVTVETGVRLHYQKLGSGKQVVVSPMGSWLAGPLAPLARANRTLILYDTRGRGRSDRVDPSKVSFANELSDLDAVRRHFELESMALMGWSHYGMMTAVYAIRHPERVSRLVQITPAGPRSEPYLAEGMQTMRSRVDGAAYEAVQQKRKAGEFEKDPASLCRALNSVIRPAFFGDPADVSKMTFDDCALENEWPEYQEKWWNALFSSMTPWDYRAEARSSKTPRLIVAGEKDFIPLAGTREWAAGNANARLLVIRGVGHHPFVERPQVFFDAVDHFLDGEWPSGAEAVPAEERSAAAKPTAELVREARAAYDRGEKPAFLELYSEIAHRRPGDVWVLYNLACAQALNGQAEAAIRTLQDVARRRVASDLDSEADFESIRKTEGYRKVVEEMGRLRRERVSTGATRAFTIPEKGFVAEGVAYDPVGKAFFVSSVRHRRIVRIDPEGRITDFVPPGADGLRSALGMRVDSGRRTLWVASEAVPSMDGYRKGQPLEAAVFEYDLVSGKLRREHRPPAREEPPGFDDLTLAPDGRVFVNDGVHPRIWTIPPGGGELELFLESDLLGGTQGLAVSADGKTLYASDYRGLFAIDLPTRAVKPIAAPADLALNGVDGLAFFDHGLVAIQNGVQPHRVIRLDLGEDGATISRARILEMNHPDLDEPTLGVIVDGTLYFSADSQGQKFLDEKHPIEPAAMREAVILKLPL